MKRYADCIRTDGMCGACSISSRGFDCHNNRINDLLYQRSLLGMTQQELAEKSGINIRQIQKYESGEYDTGNMTLKNALALACALECDAKDLYTSAQNNHNAPKIIDLIIDALKEDDYSFRINFLLAGLMSEEANIDSDAEAKNNLYLKNIYDFCQDYRGDREEYMKHISGTISRYLYGGEKNEEGV